MGDGSRQGAGLHLNVYAFDNTSVGHLVETLEKKFGLSCSIHNHYGKPRIYVKKESMEKLRTLVVPHIVPEIIYKLGLD
jgi:hypothetical protein